MSLLEPFFALSHDPMAILDLEGGFIRANPAWQTALGYEPASLAGRTISELMSSEEARYMGDWLVRVAEAGEPLTRTTSLRANGGEYRMMHLRGTRDPATDSICLLVRPSWLGHSEIDHLRAVQQRWDALVHNLPDLVLTSDVAGAVSTINRDPPGVAADAVIGRPDSLLLAVPPEQRPALREAFERATGAGEASTHETRGDDAHGPAGAFESRVAPIHDGGKIVGCLLVTRDITALRRAEAACQAAERELAALRGREAGELERFASVAAHDLQEPLRKIQAFGDRLQRKYAELLPEPGREYVHRMQEAARRMQGLLDDLLMFTRLSSRARSSTKVDLQAALKSVLTALELPIEEGEAKIECGELPTIEADPAHIHQLLQSLIGNAIKFRRPDTRPVITITGEAPGPGVVRLTVRDNGIGIDPKYHERIFGIFERLHGRNKYEGTGVGLAVCRKICELHGGSIRVESGLDRGSAFIAEFPARQERKAAES